MAARAQLAKPAPEEAETPRTPLMPDTARGELAAARAARDAVLSRISAGDHVEPGDLLDAETNLRMAEVRTELADRNAATGAENDRLRRLQELVDSLTARSHRDRLEHLLDSFRKALKASEALRAAAIAQQVAMRADLIELRRLAFDGELLLPLPAGVSIESNNPWTIATVTGNGVTARADSSMNDPAGLLAEVAATASGLPPEYSRFQALERTLAAASPSGDE